MAYPLQLESGPVGLRWVEVAQAQDRSSISEYLLSMRQCARVLVYTTPFHTPPVVL